MVAALAAESSTPVVLGYKLCLTSAASMCAEGVTYPIDLTKTRMQLQGEAGFKGGNFLGANFKFFGMARNVVKTEGVAGLWSGMTPALARHIPYTGFRTIGYEHIRTFFCGEDTDSASAPFYAKALAGMTAGGIGQAIAVPLDLIKVRMQGDGRLVAAGRLIQPRYSGLMDAFAKIKADEGIIGFYKGAGPAIQRAALVNLGELVTYDSAKNAFVENLSLSRDDMRCHLLSAFCSGFVVSLFSTPADVAKSRIMNQKRGPGGSLLYRNTLHCWVTTVNEEGFLALYKGFFPAWLRLAPWQLVFWLTYERLRIVAGIGSFK